MCMCQPRFQALKRKQRGAPGIHCSCICGSLDFSRELGNYCMWQQSVLHDCTLLNYGSHYIQIQLCLFNQAVCVPSVRLESQEGRTTDAVLHIYNDKVVFVWLPTDVAISLLHMYEFLPFVFMPRIHFWKGTSGNCHQGLGTYSSAWYSCIL